MLRPTKLAAAITTAAVALVGPALVAGPVAQAATPDKPHGRTVTVDMTNKGFTLPREVRAGFVTFEVSTKDANGHDLQGVRLHKGVTQAQLIADIRLAVSPDPKTAAKGIRQVQRDATLVGGAAVEPSTVVDDTIPLCAGTYWFFDFGQFFVPNAPPPVFHRLDVKGPFRDWLPKVDGEIDQVDTKAGPRFVSPDKLMDGGTYLVRNKAPEIHELMFQRVKPGTTNRDLTVFLTTGKGQNPFAEAVSRGLAAQSPGRFQLLSFHPKKGSYALLCFIPDDKSGIPHAFLGMHKVVKLT
ncbi:hypothetical protein [Streptacidiphilus jiangxiensis]|uniref:Uncharacterized protein n=1 Tax=Streptacidiphilus jiangxiensis TaxID=235985 RepID=A0A1H7YB69_STRJI|nr:hypothetical protein [Streptacidiphilus jiangxiensis]SEM42429.1 hypothetical protein SAMN05414137_12767 [Streptacidiphilus jiangxiensis]